VVEVNVETVTDRETIVERRIDPDSRIALSQDSEERNATSTETRSGAVSVASNLPDGDAAEGDGRTESRDVTSRQRTNYDVSQTQREIQRGPGAVRRLTVAVLIDGVRAPDAAGTMQWTPRPEAEVEALRELVASAVGFDEARGDVITIRSLPFEPVTRAEESTPVASLIDRLGLDVMSLIRLGRARAGGALSGALRAASAAVRPPRRAARTAAPRGCCGRRAVPERRDRRR
jgi:flagellar M-ring protein FliF